MRIPWRRSGGILLPTAIVCLPTFIFIILVNSMSNSGDSESEDIEGKIAELHDRLDHLFALDKSKQKSFLALQQQLQMMLDANISYAGVFSNRSSSFQRMFRANLSQTGGSISAPTIFDFLPHLLESPSLSLEPAARISRNRSNAHFVIAIPTVKRPKVSYLIQTLRSLIDNLAQDEMNEILITLFIAEIGLTPYATETIVLIQSEFNDQLESGLLEVIVPPSQFYPDFSKITPTFGDSEERMRWRTKQNLDYVYLMMYAQSKGAYYLQLEDDVITKPNYVAVMKDFISKQYQQSEQWLMIEFSSLGFIGKMFRTSDLPVMIDFILLFYKDKPVDWLLAHMFQVKLCHPEKSPKQCQQVVNKYRIRKKPSLFQHIGVQSSLKGKTQKLKEKDFGKPSLHRSHSNPKAEVSTSLKTYQKFELLQAYNGENFFWGLLPQPGDYVRFDFKPPIRIESFLLRSGNAEHPDDQFFNSTVQIHAEKKSDLESLNSGISDDHWAIVAEFTQSGKAEASLNTTFAVDSLRIVVHSESQNWVILSEIWIKPLGN